MTAIDERAWAAGFFDGEGCTYVQLPYHITVSISQSGEGAREILERFRRAVGGVGAISGPHPNSAPGRKPKCDYKAKGQFDARSVIDMIWPWLSDIKRAQAEKAFAAYYAAPVRRQGRRRLAVQR